MATINMRLTVAVLALTWSAALHAQSAAPVLKMNQVTEQALVDALAIDEPTVEAGAKTRSIRPTARNNASPATACTRYQSSPPPPTPSPPSPASMLVTATDTRRTMLMSASR